MKKFEFSMQKVLEYKTHVKDKEKNVLAQMRSRYQEVYDEMIAMQQVYNEFNKQYAARCTLGITIRELAIARTYMADLAERIEQMFLLLEKAAREIDLQLDRVIEVSKEKSSMDKLKDRCYVVYREQQRKEMEIFIDDFVANTSHMALQVN